MSSKPFRSTGTIRVRSESGGRTKLFFTPNTDSTFRYGDKTYAVFVRGEGAKACFTSKPLGDSCEGVSIKVKRDILGLVAAAAQQVLVEVETKKYKSDLVLRAITIPAPGKKK